MVGIGKGGGKRKGTRFWEMKNETKILYLARVYVTEPKEVLIIGFLSHVEVCVLNAGTCILSCMYIILSCTDMFV